MVKVDFRDRKSCTTADGAIIATLGETVVIATAVGAKKVAEGQDYFPLSVNYQKNIMQLVKYLEGILKRSKATWSWNFNFKINR